MHPQCLPFANLVCLAAWLNEASLAIADLVQLSRYCGQRFDLTQAAGGNISVKFGRYMLIKSSGIHLADVDDRLGYSVVENDRLKLDMAADTHHPLDSYLQFSTTRPSIETFMHAGLGRYTVHLHPLQMNAVLTSKGARARIAELFPNAQVIDYITPGLKLACAINTDGEVQNQVIFLLNHGVIFATDQLSKMVPLIESTLNLFSEIIGFDDGAYKAVNVLATLLDNELGGIHAVYLCEDVQVQSRFIGLADIRPTFPDAVVYCGVAVLFLNNADAADLHRFVALHGIPKLIAMQSRLYIVDGSLQKCRDTESVIKSILMMQDALEPRSYLDETEVNFLNNWEAERYRRKLQK